MAKHLTDKCHWELTLNGENVNLGSGSDKELDLVLKERLADVEFLIKDKGSLNKLFSITGQEAADKRIAEIRQTVSETAIERMMIVDGEEERYLQIPGSKGVTRFLAEYGLDGKPFIPPFDQAAWKENRIKAFMEGKTTVAGVGKEEDRDIIATDKKKRQIKTLQDGVSEEEARKEAERLVDIEIASWKRLTKIGTQTHKIFEEVLSGATTITTPDPDLIPEPVFKALKRQAEEFQRSLVQKYPNCKIYTELGIKSKFLSAEWKEKLGRNGLDSINGVIDLLVIDAAGNAHVYDYKISRKAVGAGASRTVREWFEEQDNFLLSQNEYWHTTKKMAAEDQLIIYSEMLRQYGFRVTDATVVPVKLDIEYEDDGFTVKQTKAAEMWTGVRSIPINVNTGNKRATFHQVFRNVATIDPASISAIDKIQAHIFPMNNTMSQVAANKADKDYYKKSRPDVVSKLSVTDPQYSSGKRWGFRASGIPGAHWKYVATEEELDAMLDDYIAQIAEKRKTMSLNIAANLMKMRTDENFMFKDFIDAVKTDLDAKSTSFLKLQFERYAADPEWSFEANDDMNSQGIFVFKKDDVCEIVVLSTQALRTTMNLGMGHTLVGKNTKDTNTDTTKDLPAMTGYMELIKVLSYVGLNQSSFDDCQIAEIRAINPVNGEEVSTNNSRLLMNYEKLRQKNPDAHMPRIPNKLFMVDERAYAWCAMDRARFAGTDGEYSIDDCQTKDTKYWHKEFIIKAIDRLQRKSLGRDENGMYKFESMEAWAAYKRLYDAYNAINGFQATTYESDKGDYISGNWAEGLNGLMVSSPQFSPSANVRELGKVIDQFSKEVHKEVYELTIPIALKLQQLYKERGTGANVFAGWFERTADGELDPRMMLKDPDSPEFNGSKTERELLRAMLDTLAQLKDPNLVNNPDGLEKQRKTDEYREVPLLEAKASRQLKALGLKKMLQNKWEEGKHLSEGLFQDDADFGTIMSYAEKNGKLYNKFEISGYARQDRINKHGVGMFETDMELVFRAAVVAYVKANKSKQYMPIINGMKLGLQYADAYTSEKYNMHNIYKAFDKIVKSKFYGESIVDDKLRPTLSFINAIKSIFTTMTLSLNNRSMFRETLQGIYTGLSRAGVRMLPGVDSQTYTKALLYTVQECPKNLSGVAMLQQLNMQAGMANQSLSQLAEGNRVNWLNIKHWGKDTLFLTATSPDFLHRMSILVAKMMGDGCWDAHSVDAEGKLHYDFKKDERFKEYLAGNTSHKDYMKQRSLYLTYLEEFKNEGFKNKEGKKLKEGDDLPQAYTQREYQSIKNYADFLYGHYDDESRSLLCDTFAGSLLLQYKTFITAKFEQWTMKGGTYNTEMLKEQIDSVTGEKIYQHFYEDEEGAPHRDFLLESEYNALSEEDKAKCRQYYDYTGMPMEGMLQSSWSFTRALFTMDGEELKALWEDPTKRTMLKLMLHDQFLMMLAGFLITFIFGRGLDADKPLDPFEVRKLAKQAGPATSFAYNVLAGSVEDAQFQNLMTNFSNKPPFIVAAQRLGTSSWDLMTGDSNLVHWATKNFGAVRDFEGLAAQLND